MRAASIRHLLYCFTVWLALLAPLGGCASLEGLQILFPESAGLRPAGTALYVEPGMSDQTVADVRAARQWAYDAVARAFGGVRSAPITHACATEDCYRRFGGHGDRARVYGQRILLSPRGLTPALVAHEWSHAELLERMGFAAWLGVPSWFDEGLAVAVSDEPETGEAHWQWLAANNVPRPTRDALLAAHSRAAFIALTRQYGDAGNPQRIARGEMPIRPAYSAAGHEVRPWLAAVGSAGLTTLIERVRGGEDFMTVYRALAPTRQPDF